MVDVKVCVLAELSDNTIKIMSKSVKSSNCRIGILFRYTEINTKTKNCSQNDCLWKVEKVGTGTTVFHCKAFRFL